jgi:hypothetical protein
MACLFDSTISESSGGIIAPSAKIRPTGCRRLQKAAAALA